MKSFAQIKKPLLIASGVVATTVFFSSIGLAVFASTYQDRIAPNIFIGPIAVGGMSFLEAQNRLYTHTDALLAEGISISFEKEKKTLALVSIGTDNTDTAVDPVFFDIEQTLVEARTNGRHQNLLRDGISLLHAYFFSQHLPVIVRFDKPRLAELIKNAFPQKEEPAQNAQFDFISTNDVWEITIIPSQNGTKFDTENFF